MWYHPAALILSWRDVAGAWLFCLVAAAAILGWAALDAAATTLTSV